MTDFLSNNHCTRSGKVWQGNPRKSTPRLGDAEAAGHRKNRKAKESNTPGNKRGLGEGGEKQMRGRK